ncbi:MULTISPECIES: phosphate-starvation-inducible PsiE family protein [unclassified Shewanella]|uniref:phosphate-starvation-inducible protein PsiE n=1 Tax=unclassified Shewanella TaxID=196818 RepID=UPI0009710BF8|nr:MULTISPECIES: phosphate-starvation-inducible PsiE family protein [unclassified Shewanella]MDO6619458.1 phosphate-starvation-inducible PsiE family protein [Shewanella sp. 6_MG-2023]MDO6639412.1 phosphate-starvation-inducible PsiE family protein [Shewanella sp. 5_MG-2023]MDO6678173.1 phosphate-starvation-inducible PsiE family protein [Shewanella sp. 4_MG-2023]MDO6775912.1 phosphate-starvation-inducible PsiE family protein [Shewanella sp. 3_MG-2023]PMG30303.1 phosphate starvation-inducible pro
MPLPILRQIGVKSLKGVEHIVLFIISLATVFAIGEEVMHMFDIRTVELADLLLLFIYLEVLAMVVNYLESGKLPIRMPLYIAIVALARYLILDMKDMDDWRILAISVSTIVLAATVIVIRWGQLKLPYPKSKDFD